MRARLTAFVVTPAPAGARGGNRVTALRWGKRLRELGWHVRVAQDWRWEPCDLLVALHARKSHAAIARHAERAPSAPRLVALTGTDLYGDIHTDANARESLELATRLLLLQPLGARQLPERLHAKLRTIRQSALPPREPMRVAPPDAFVVCALGHLRPVKDPLLGARAVELLPRSSRVRVVHLGFALEDEWRRRAEQAARDLAPRWTWLGGRSRTDALRILAGANALILTSTQEGGANVVTEAIACRVPVLSTRIEGSLGILGDDYPGYFEVGDASALARLLHRCETEPAFHDLLRARCETLRPLTLPAREREAWSNLLAEVVTPRQERQSA